MENKKTSPSSSREQEEDYYSVLDCSQSSTIGEIKINYRKLIKKFHPDKQIQGGTAGSDVKFINVDRAFKTLSDEKLRKEYDASLLENRLNENSLIYAELTKADLVFDSDGLAFYPCRCGQNIEISQEVLAEEECLIECSECTNCVLIK